MQTELSLKSIPHASLFAVAILAIVALDCSSQSPATSRERDSAFALEQEGRNAEAEAAWRSVLKLHPGDAEAYAHLGLLEARQEHYKEAVPLYRKALALKPSMPSLRLNLGLALFKSGALKDAADTFTTLLKTQPPSSPEA